MSDKIDLLKTEQVKCRVTSAEKKLVIQFAEKETEGNVSEYVRYRILKNTTHNPKVLQSLANIEFQMKKIGTNINQIVRAYHADFFSEEDKQRLQHNLDRLESLFLEFNDEMQGKEEL